MELVWMQEKQTTAARQFKYLWIAIAILLFDQLLKIIVKVYLPLYDSKPVLGNLLMLTHVQNTGAAFSISLGNTGLNRIFFITVPLLAIVFVAYLIYRSTTRLQQFALSMIIGGALGNLSDRILFGYVTDFIDMDFPNFIMQRWPVFNVADSAIVIAMGLLVLDMIIHKPGEEIKHNDINSDVTTQSD